MKHYNPSISRDCVRILNLKGESTDLVDDVLVPVIPIVRFNNVVREVEGAGSGNATIFTTPADKDFYLTSWVLNYATDAACDTVTIAIQCTIEGVSRYLIRKKKITTTADDKAIVCTYTEPIKIDRNTVMSLVCSFAAGNCPRSCTITGYTMETLTSSGI